MADRIVIAEDDPALSRVLQLGFTTAGFEVLLARDGYEALNLAREQSPALVLLDVGMPKLTGFEVARLLRFDSKYAHIPIVMVTARREDQDRTVGLKTGADRYFTKPFSFDELLPAVTELIGRARAGEAAAGGKTQP